MELKVKKWFIDKVENESKAYNTYIDVKRAEDRAPLVEDGYYTVYVDEVIIETEKAIKVKLSTGNVVGSYKGWTTFIPKSLIA